MKHYGIIIFALLLLAGQAQATDSYRIDDVAVGQLIDKATETAWVNLDLANRYSPDGQTQLQSKNVFVAWVLTYTIFGFHRLYLGTSSRTFFAYFCTAGGFLILDIIDFGVLLLAVLENRPVEPYANNPHLFVWKN